MSDLQTKAVKSVFWVGLFKMISQAISWGVTIWLIRILSPEDYGLMGIALAYKMLLAVFFDLSVGEAVLQRRTLESADCSTAFWICIALATLLYTLTWVLAPAWAAFFGSDELIDIIRVMGLSVFFLALKEVSGRLMARAFEFKRRSQAELVAGIFALIVSLALAVGGFGVWALVLGELVKDVILAGLIFYFARWWPTLLFSLHSARELLRYGVPVTAHYLLEFVSSKSDSLIIGRILGQEALGYYTVAMSVSRIPVNKGIQVIQTVLFPLFAAVQKDNKEFQRYFGQVVYIVAVTIFPVFFGMFVLAEEIVVVVLSPKWLPSLFAFQVFCILGLLFSYAGILVVILKSRGNTGAVFRFSLLAALLFPIGFYIGSGFGLTGVSLVWLVVYPPLFGYLYHTVARELSLSTRDVLDRVSHAFLGSCVMVVAVYAIKRLVFGDQADAWSMVLGAGVGAFVYTAYFWAFSRHTFGDIRKIWRSLRS